MTRGRLIRIGLTAVAALVGAVLFAQASAVRSDSVTVRAAMASLPAEVRSDHGAAARAEQSSKRLRTELAGVRPIVARLTRDQNAVQQSAWHATYGPTRDAAYNAAYADAFPLNLSTGAWYVVRVTRSGGYHTTSWAAPAGREYVVADGQVTAYAPGTAPSPYYLPDSGYDSTTAPYAGADPYSGVDTYSGTDDAGTYPGPGDVPGYTNSAGNWVPSPSYNPNLTPGGPSAICGDGTYSYSQSSSGTCSHHGGVSSWTP